MATEQELNRLAAAMAVLRPDWPVKSLTTYLTTYHAARPYADLLIAAAWICGDPKTHTPARLGEHGPWWVAAGLSTAKATPTVGPGAEPRCGQDGHEHELARACRWCRSDTLGGAEERDDSRWPESDHLKAKAWAAHSRQRREERAAS